jgi:integrase
MLIHGGTQKKRRNISHHLKPKKVPRMSPKKKAPATPREIEPVKRYLTPADLQRIEDVPTNRRDKLLIRLLRRMAGRINEVLGIAEDDIDFSERLIQIVHEKARVTRFCPDCASKGIKTRLGKTWVTCPKCSNPVPEAITKHNDDVLLRQVPVDQETLQMIRQYIKNGGTPEAVRSIRKGGKLEVRVRRWLFTITRQYAWALIVKYAEEAGFMEMVNPKTGHKHHVSPHTFRHAFIIAAVKGASPEETRTLQEIVGHQNYNTTAAYDTVDGTRSREFYDKMLAKQGADAKPAQKQGGALLDAYGVLGASPDDPTALIKDLYRKKAGYYHPDKPGGDAEKFKRLQDAYDLIMQSRKPKAGVKRIAAHKEEK